MENAKLTIHIEDKNMSDIFRLSCLCTITKHIDGTPRYHIRATDDDGLNDIVVAKKGDTLWLDKTNVWHLQRGNTQEQ